MAEIIIIDDDENILNLFTLILKQDGHSVRPAENGRIGILLASEKTPDLVITDIVMPEKEGLETISDLKELSKSIKIIVISGGGKISPDYYLKIAKSLGADLTFQKPVDLKILTSSVNKLLAQ